MFLSSIIFALGCIISAFAPTLAVFLLGRAVTGLGAAGIYTVSTIVVLQLTGPKQRGIAIGVLNSSFTVGISLGAVIGGALVSRVGWVTIQNPFRLCSFTDGYNSEHFSGCKRSRP